jgi:hypothetical protein
MCVCVYMCVSERKCFRLCTYMRIYACMCVYVCVRVRACLFFSLLLWTLAQGECRYWGTDEHDEAIAQHAQVPRTIHLHRNRTGGF